jgi:hypothetical protein
MKKYRVNNILGQAKDKAIDQYKAIGIKARR